MINKMNKGSLGKIRETNKSRGESMGQGSHEIYGIHIGHHNKLNLSYQIILHLLW